MTLIALASAKGSPGVTTAMVALSAVWPAERPLLLVEADPDGGDLAARAGLRPEPGLTTLAAAGRRALADGEVERHVQELPGGTPALLAPPEAERAGGALGLVAPRLTKVLAGDESRDVLVDCGRLRLQTVAQPFVDRAAMVLLVVRPRLDELQHVAARLRSLSETEASTAVVLCGEGPYGPTDVSGALGVRVLGALPPDPRAAAALTGAATVPRSLHRTALVRSARGLVETILDAAETAGTIVVDRRTNDAHLAGTVDRGPQMQAATRAWTSLGPMDDGGTP